MNSIVSSKILNFFEFFLDLERKALRNHMRLNGLSIRRDRRLRYYLGPPPLPEEDRLTVIVEQHKASFCNCINLSGGVSFFKIFLPCG